MTKEEGNSTKVTNKLFTIHRNSKSQSTTPPKSRKSKKANPKGVQPPAQDIFFRKLPAEAKIIETYEVTPPFSKITIASLPELGGGYGYYIDEIALTDEEQKAQQLLMDILSKELEPPAAKEDSKDHISHEARRVAKKYGIMKKIPESSWSAVEYYLHRNLVGYGNIDVVMKDALIEDLSVNGLNLPVYVWHRKYESMPTNLVFTDENELDNLIVKLTHLSGKHISTAFPILDAMLPGKDRLAATYKHEVSPKGGSFSIRRFREEPFSMIDLIEMGTINEEMAAYFWLLIENRMTVAVVGGTGAGKTSTLNALASLVKPAMKIVTVEEIPEMNLHHENWVQLVSRESYGLGEFKTGEVTLFDLVKTSLRYRPDYIVVGEIRGEEAFVLFQALATGHGGLTTLHAENIDYAVKRLTSRPMNVAESYIPLLNVVPVIERVKLPATRGSATFGRRIKSLIEIVDYNKYRTVCNWDPVMDRFDIDLSKSHLFGRIAERQGLNLKDVLAEAHKRVLFLKDLQKRGIRDNIELAKHITNYYNEINHLGVQVDEAK